MKFEDVILRTESIFFYRIIPPYYCERTDSSYASRLLIANDREDRADTIVLQLPPIKTEDQLKILFGVERIIKYLNK